MTTARTGKGSKELQANTGGSASAVWQLDANACAGDRRTRHSCALRGLGCSPGDAESDATARAAGVEQNQPRLQ
jgi:hypothetical protein